MYKLSRLALVAGLALALYGLAALLWLVVLAAPWVLLVLGALGLRYAARRARRPHLTAHGTARFATPEDVRRAGLFEGRDGLILGTLAGTRPSLGAAVRALLDRRVPAPAACRQLFAALRRRPGGEWVRLRTGVHAAIFAPTGAGKNVSCIFPFLLECPDSCVVIDFKGENARLTAAHRRRAFGHRTVVLDPFRVATDRPDALNALDGISKDAPGALDDVRTIAEALVVRSGQEKEPHWTDSAELWIGAMLACVARYAPGDDRSLQTVRGLLSDPAKMETAVQLLCASGDEFLARIGHQLTQFKDKELAGVLTTSNRFLRFLDTPAVAASTRASTFRPADLRRGRMTVYLVLPPEHMRACMGLLRLWVGTLLRAVVGAGLQEAHKVHFLLDEAASLGHGMNALADAVDKYRGYGIRCQFYYQSMGQLKQCWPEDQGQTLLSNAAQVFFAVNDLPTAEYVSSRLGEATIVVASGGSNSGHSSSHASGGASPGQGNRGTSGGRSDNWAQAARKVLKPDEVLNLDPRTAVTFAPGVPPLATRLVRHFEEPGLGRRPGLLGRGLAALRTLAASLALFALAAAFAAAATDAAEGEGRRPAQGPVIPNEAGAPPRPPGRSPNSPSPAPKGR